MRGGVLPAESIDQVIHILFEELVYHAKGVFVGRRVKIKRAPEEMMGGIRDKELLGGSGVAGDIEEDPSYSVMRDERGVFDSVGLIGMLEGKLVGVVSQPVEFVLPYCLVADVNACAEAGKVDVYPPGILGDGIEIRTVLQDLCIYGIFEGIGEAGLVKGLVLMGREIDLKIATTFGSVDGVTGEEEKEN